MIRRPGLAVLLALAIAGDAGGGAERGAPIPR